MYMKELKDRIMKDGRCLDGGIMKVDMFVNHQMDPVLMYHVAQEFQRRFAELGANKILTVEASGIAPAIMLGYLMRLPVVFAKKRKPATIDQCYQSVVYSFTKRANTPVIVSRDYLSTGDRVIFIDDFLASGSAAMGMIDICQQAGAEIVGMGFVIEKIFQNGHLRLLDAGVSHIESLACVTSLANNEIVLAE